MNFRDNWGSILSLIGGALLFLGAVGQITNPNGNHSGLVSGPVMILGALIYRSAKKRRETQNNNLVRVIGELVGLLAILFLAFGQNNLQQRLITDPVSNLIIPVWALIAYVVAAYRGYTDKRGTEIE